MTGPELVKLADEMAAVITLRIADPSKHTAELIRVAKAIGVNPNRVRWNSKLHLSTFALVDEANRHGYTADEIKAAMR
jgi:predicted transcriptional regulator